MTKDHAAGSSVSKGTEMIATGEMRSAARRRLVARAIVVLAATLYAGVTLAAGTYKWTDEQGVVHYSDKAPPEAPRGATVLDKQGRAVKKIDPPLSPEQLKAKADEEERQRALAKAKDEQARKDRALMQSYTSENEIDIARSRAVATIESQIKSAEAFSTDLTRRQQNIAKQKASYGNKPIPIELERESAAVDSELSRQTILIRQKQEEMTLATAKYDTIKQRWREIIADQERAAAAAAAAAEAQAAAKGMKAAAGKSPTGQGSTPTTSNK